MQMKLLLILQLALVVASPLTLGSRRARVEFSKEWHLWKTEHGKSYEDEREELRRHAIWVSNMEYIEHHNEHADNHSFTLRMNHFGDLTAQEFADVYQCVKDYQPANVSALNEKYGNKFKLFDKRLPASSLPVNLDWRTSGAVTAVKDQLRCGCSYAFAAIGALEGSRALAYGNLVRLSEQNIVDCSVPYGNHACSCGDVYNSYLYVIDNDGVDTEYGYRYQAQQHSCQYNRKYRGATARGIVSVTSGDEDSLLTAIATVGPISVYMDASHTSFQFYAGGILDVPYCSSSRLSHALLLTGYGNNGYKDYWLLKNSWGPHWGDSGYIRMVRGKYNQCGVATAASYPTQ